MPRARARRQYRIKPIWGIARPSAILAEGTMSDLLSYSRVDKRPRPVARVSSRKTPAVPAPFSPLVEQALLFGLFAAAALFWIAMIWWIVR